MTPEQFCYWLQGRAELLPDQHPTAEEWQSIRDHLATVFHKVTTPAPTYFPSGPFPSRTPTWPLVPECSVSVPATGATLIC